MRNLLLACAVAFLAGCSTGSNQGYTVNVTFKGDVSRVENQSMILLGGTSLSPDADTAVITGGKATFSGTTSTPTSYSLFFMGRRYPFLPVFIENAEYNIIIDLDRHLRQAVIEGGGPVQQFLSRRDAGTARLRETVRYDSIMKSRPTDRSVLNRLRYTLEHHEDSLDQVYMQQHPHSPFTLCNKAEDIEHMPVAEAERILAGFEALPEFAGNLVLKEAQASLEKIKTLQPGKKAPDFTQNDIHGNPVTLSDIYRRNKVTMIDFWASWCGPCRAFNPTLREIYSEYHDKGFEIVGVSLDNSQENWEDGVKTDQLPWIHVSDLAKWKNAVAQLYYVKFVPQNLLVDGNGTILARQLGSKEEIVKIIEAHL